MTIEIHIVDRYKGRIKNVEIYNMFDFKELIEAVTIKEHKEQRWMDRLFYPDDLANAISTTLFCKFADRLTENKNRRK